MTKETDRRNQNEAIFFSPNEPALMAKLFLNTQRNGMTIQLHNVNEKHVLKNHDLINCIFKYFFFKAMIIQHFFQILYKI